MEEQFMSEWNSRVKRAKPNLITLSRLVQERARLTISTGAESAAAAALVVCACFIQTKPNQTVWPVYDLLFV